MSAETKSDLQPAPEQFVYANLLLIGAWGGIFLLVVTYIIYVTGILPSHVDISLIAQNWDKGVQEYMHITHSPHGWGWISLLAKGDFLNFVGIALLGLMTVLCYTVLLRGYLRQKDRVYAVICLAEILVLVVAASGILGAGGH